VTATIHWFDEVDSTNRAARADDFGHGDVIATLNQHSGRGRRDRTWSMAPGDGIAMTIVVSRSQLGSPQFLTRLPLVTAVGVVRTFIELNPGLTAPTVKWPNDILIGGRKVAGILVESFDDDRLGIGIGINVHRTPADLPEGAATSLHGEGHSGDATDIVSHVADVVLMLVAQLDEPATLELLTDSIDTIGRRVIVERPDGTSINGRAVGLGESGSLLVDTLTGRVELVAGDVTHLRLEG
jgi:BirA family biotin operon repressor/biotin-[acetyl-CoA-carboxylase] ligase